jgi:hypothetical protein
LHDDCAHKAGPRPFPSTVDSLRYGDKNACIEERQEVAATDDREPLCLGGRGAAPPESCCGPRGYRLMLKRQQQGVAVSDPALVEATSGSRLNLSVSSIRVSSPA